MTTTITILGTDTVVSFPTPTDLTGLISIGDFLSANLANTIVINVDEETLFTGTGLEAIQPFRQAIEHFNTEGNNVLLGTEEDDILFGTAESDTMVGGDGNDLFIGGAGNDSFIGGKGDDTVSFTHVPIESLTFVFGQNDDVDIFHEESGTEVTFVGIESLKLDGVVYTA